MISSAYAIHQLTSISLLPPLHPQISKFSYVGQAHRSRSVAIDPSRPYVSSSWTAGQYWRWNRAGAWQYKLYPQGARDSSTCAVDHPFKRYKLIRMPARRRPAHELIYRLRAGHDVGVRADKER